MCEKCGREHLTVHGNPACTAHITSGERRGEPCSHEAGYGTSHKGFGQCKFHGGATYSGTRAAQAARLSAEAERLLGIEGFDPITDPYTQLAELAGEVVKLKDVLRDKVEELSSLRDVGDENVATQIDVVFAAYERSIERCERVLMGMARLDLEDRIAKLHTKINSVAAEKIITSLTAALDEAGIEEPTRGVILSGFGTRLRDDSGSGSRPAVGQG